MVSERAFIFHVCIPCGKTVSLVRVKCQGQIFQKMAISVSQRQLVQFGIFYYPSRLNKWVRQESK